MGQVGAVLAFLLRRTNAQEMHVGEFGGHVVVGGEPQPPGRQAVDQQLTQTGFVKRDITRGELGHFARIDVDPDDVVAQLRHTDGVGGAQVAGAENGASHTHGVGGRDELTASLR